MILPQQPKKNDISIITKNPVMHSFDNKNCHLYAVIKFVGDDELKQERVYKVATYLAIYENDEILLFNTDQTPKTDNNGNLLTEAIEKLVIVETRQDWSKQVIPYDKITQYTQIVAPEIPEGMDEAAKDNLKIQLMFLKKRQQAAPYNIPATEWKLCKPEDLERPKPV